MAEVKTVRVRIAVVVDDRGEWGASGQSGCDDDWHASEAEAWLSGGYSATRATRVTWVVAEVPMPTVDEVVTVEGRSDG